MHFWHKSALDIGLKLACNFGLKRPVGGGVELLKIPLDEVEVFGFDELGMLNAFLRTNWGSETVRLVFSVGCRGIFLELQLLLLGEKDVDEAGDGLEIDWEKGLLEELLDWSMTILLSCLNSLAADATALTPELLEWFFSCKCFASLDLIHWKFELSNNFPADLTSLGLTHPPPPTSLQSFWSFLLHLK